MSLSATERGGVTALWRENKDLSPFEETLLPTFSPRLTRMVRMVRISPGNVQRQEEKTDMAEKRFVEVYSQGMTSIYKIIVDTHTGVNYLIAFNAACGSGMTVLLDAEGKPVVTPMREA